MSTTFEALKLRPELLKACRRQGFKKATPIQALVIPVVASGQDVIVEAKTGSGKTLAYGLPLLNREPLQTLVPEVLVIAPTRELAQQIEAELVKSAGTLKRTVVALTGRGGMDRQKQLLDAGATIVVGTVGRLEELVERRILRLDHIRTIVLDEVDELLRGGFASNLTKLSTHIPPARQTLLFSATVPTELETLAKQFTRNAARLRLSVARELPAELSHCVYFTSVEDRVRNLVAYLRAERPFQALVFCGTRHETEEVQEGIAELGLEVEFLHGELSPNKRKQLLARVRSGDLPILVASDLAARGLDLPGVDLVVNYSLPQGTAPYLHRAGRTGRAGRPGTVLSLVIGQQHETFEKLKGTFTFKSVEVTSDGALHRDMISREERDLKHRKLPRPERHWDAEPKTPLAKKETPRTDARPPRKALASTDREKKPGPGHEPPRRYDGTQRHKKSPPPRRR